MKKTITCTVCPNGCQVEVEYTTKEDIVLTGNRCNRGIEYCTNECFDPKRTFTASVPICGAGRRMMPVRTTGPVPKDMIMQCAESVHKLSLESPVESHQIIEKDFLGTGVDLIAAMSL